MSKVSVYTTDYCPYCERAKGLLKKKAVTFEEVDVTNDFAKRQWLVEKTGMYTVPQIFINEESIGGYEELAALERQGELDALLTKAQK